MDKVVIEALVCSARVGVSEAERARPQKILLDIELGLDLTGAGRYDCVEETIDYADVCAQAKRVAESRPFKLVEALAEEVADLLLEKFRPAETKVRVRKFSVPGAVSVGVDLCRVRSRGT